MSGDAARVSVDRLPVSEPVRYLVCRREKGGEGGRRREKEGEGGRRREKEGKERAGAMGIQLW